MAARKRRSEALLQRRTNERIKEPRSANQEPRTKKGVEGGGSGRRPHDYTGKNTGAGWQVLFRKRKETKRKRSTEQRRKEGLLGIPELAPGPDLGCGHKGV
jgi:hypothetical protein